MKIRWNGHSSFTIISKDDLTIVTDPYESGAFGGGIAYFPVDAEPDIVTISHEHADHNYTAGFKGEFEEVRGDKTIKSIEFTCFDTFHDTNQGADRGKNRIFCFAVDDIRICHLGDLGHILDSDQIEKLGSIDVMFMPVGGFYTIDAAQATDIFEKVRPKIAIPMHYKTEKCGFPIAEVDEFSAGKATVQKIDSDEIELTADKLPGEPEIIILKHRL